jgi:hypothetical protein
MKYENVAPTFGAHCLHTVIQKRLRQPALLRRPTICTPAHTGRTVYRHQKRVNKLMCVLSIKEITMHFGVPSRGLVPHRQYRCPHLSMPALHRRVRNLKRPGRFHQAFACIRFALRTCPCPHCSDVSKIKKGLAEFTRNLLASDLHSSVRPLKEHIEQRSRLVFTCLAMSAFFVSAPWACAPGCVQLLGGTACRTCS